MNHCISHSRYVSGPSKKKLRVKIEQFWENKALHGFVNAKLVTVIFKDFSIFGVAPSSEGVRQDVKVGADPLGLPLEVEPDLGGGKMARHLQADLVAGATVLEKVEAGRGIRLSSDHMDGPGGAPEVAGDDMGEKLEVCDIKVLEMGRGRASDIFIVGKVEYANAG